MKYLILLAAIMVAPAFATELPSTNVDPAPYPDTLTEATSPRASIVNREARLSQPLYLTELPDVIEVQSRSFTPPAGWKMVEVPHPDKVICSSYPQPSTWELVQINKPVQYVPRVGESNADSIAIIAEGIK